MTAADAGLAAWVAQVRRSPGAPCRDLGAPALRRAARDRAAARPPGPALHAVRDLLPDGAPPLRLHRADPSPRPMVLFVHGGGFVMGDLDTHDATCRRLAVRAGVAVLAVDQRLAPEHPGPAAVEDVVAAALWAARHPGDLGGDPGRPVALAGDSSGAAIAVLAAARLRDLGQPLAGLLLVCPNADLELAQPSVVEQGGWGLEADDLRWFVEQWCPDPGRRTAPALSPLHADLRGLPPTVLATAEHDPLHDEGVLLAARLARAGVDVRHAPHPGLVHGFLGLGHVSPAAARAGADLLTGFGALLR